MGTIVKWYIELARNTFTHFSYLAMVFLIDFQLPICYDTCTELLTSRRKSTSTHISDHIHEWRRHRSLIKEKILDQFLVGWFVKSQFPTLAKYVAMSRAMTEEKLIQSAQKMDLIYSQSCTLYDLIPLVARPTSNPARPLKGNHVDGVIGSVSQIDRLTQQMGQVSVQTSVGAESHSYRKSCHFGG